VGCGHGLPGIYAMLEVKQCFISFALVSSIKFEKCNDVLTMVD